MRGNGGTDHVRTTARAEHIKTRCFTLACGKAMEAVKRGGTEFSRIQLTYHKDRNSIASTIATGSVINISIFKRKKTKKKKS